MDFVVVFPKTTMQHDSIMVVLEKLSKTTRVATIKYTPKEKYIFQIFMKEIVRPHGVPKKIISNWDAKFTSKFWKHIFH